MKREASIVRHYQYQGEDIFTLGFVNYRKAHPPLKLHDHQNRMEFVYMVKGTQKYQVDDCTYTLNQGDLFFTRPHERHDTGAFPEEISTIFFLIIDLQLLSKIDLFISPLEYTAVQKHWDNSKSRICRPPASLVNSFKRLLSCFDNPDVHFHSRVRNALSEVIIGLSSSQETINTNTISIKNSLEYIHNHLDIPIRASELPDMDFLSHSAYHKEFVKAKGVPPGEYILKCKIEKAKEMLASTDLSVTEISYCCGFSSSQYFATVFKRFSYKSPTEYRASNPKMRSTLQQDSL